MGCVSIGPPPQGARLRMDGAFNQPMPFRYVALIADGAPTFLTGFLPWRRMPVI